MKAAVLTAPEKIEILDVQPTPLKRGQVLVRVLYAGLCGSQVEEYFGRKGNYKFIPHLMGHEGYGIVESVGEDVTSVRVHDYVVMHWRPGKGIESDFPKYVLNDEIITSGKVTAFSQYAIVSENRVTAVPFAVADPTFFPLLGCAITTAFGVVENELSLRYLDSAYVIGCGGLGLHIVQAIVRNGGIAYAYDIKESETLKGLVGKAGGHFIKPGQLGTKVDHIIDTTGNIEAIKSVVRNSLKVGGNVILVAHGVSKEEVRNSIDHPFGYVIETEGGRCNPSEDIIRLSSRQYTNPLETFVDMTFSLWDIDKAFDHLINGRVNGRILIEVPH